MDEFRKPFEYDDEKGRVSGLLLLFCIMLLIEEPILGLLTFFSGYDFMPGNKVLGIIIMILASVYVLFSVFSAIALNRKKAWAVKVTKAFLAFRFVYMIPYIYFDTRRQISKIPYYETNENFAVARQSIITSLFLTLGFVVIFSVYWYLYLLRSKKVKELFPEELSKKKPVSQDTAG